MQLRELPKGGGQLKISGGVVNVPANVNSTITCLPRSLNESYTVPITFKRRLGPYFKIFVRALSGTNDKLP